MINADFRAAFPEFADTTKFPDASLNFWAGVAEQMVDQCRWGTMWVNGVYLYVAHEISLARNAVLAAERGGASGLAVGPVSQKSVGDVSVSYESTADPSLNAGHWGLTTYGRQYLQLARMFGAGVVQL